MNKQTERFRALVALMATRPSLTPAGMADLLASVDRALAMVNENEVPLKHEGIVEIPKDQMNALLHGLYPNGPLPTVLCGLGPTTPPAAMELSPLAKEVQAYMAPDKHGDKGIPARSVLFGSFSSVEDRTLKALWVLLAVKHEELRRAQVSQRQAEALAIEIHDVIASQEKKIQGLLEPLECPGPPWDSQAVEWAVDEITRYKRGLETYKAMLLNSEQYVEKLEKRITSARVAYGLES